MANYYEQIDETIKKQVEEALLSIAAQEKAAKSRLEAQREQALSGLNLGLAGAYSDYAHAVNPYGINNENLYSSGLGGSGKSETAKAQYYGAYTALLGSLKDTYSKEITELGLQEGELEAQMLGLRTDVHSRAYNKMLDELIRRQQAQIDAERFEYQKLADERDYNFKLQQAQYRKEKDERDFNYKVASNAAKGYGSSSAAEKEESELPESLSFPGTGRLDNEQFAQLKKVFKWLNWSVLPDEDNPTVRIRQTKAKYIELFKDRLSADQLRELSAI